MRGSPQLKGLIFTRKPGCLEFSMILFISQTGPFLLRHFRLVTVLATKDFQPEGFYLCFSKLQSSILDFLQKLVYVNDISTSFCSSCLLEILEKKCLL